LLLLHCLFGDCLSRRLKIKELLLLVAIAKLFCKVRCNASCFWSKFVCERGCFGGGILVITISLLLARL
jgi:hypothetical protein